MKKVRGKQKLDLILSAPDPGQLVRALPPQELYFALLDIGPEDAPEVVAMASPEQFRHLVDMSVWRGSDEGPRTSGIMEWLRLAREGADDDTGFRGQLWSLDIELLALLLRRELTVHDITEEEPSLPENPGMAWYTPDRRFVLEFSATSDYAAVRQLVEDLYTQDPFGAGQLLERTRWELLSELEESARRWRDGRLRDSGVPDFEEAISFYARPATRAAPPPPPAPDRALTAPKPPLLDAALDALSAGELEHAEEAVVYAANAALVANRVPLDDPDEVREQLRDARATLSLGLALLSGDDGERAARVLVTTPIRAVFQAAMGEVYRLQTRARQIAAQARLPQAQTATILDEPLENAVQALLRQRPQFHEPGQRRPRAFGSRAEVASAEALLDEAQATVAFLASLGLSLAEIGRAAEEAGLGPGVVKASLAVRGLLRSQLRGEPFSLRGVADETETGPELRARMEQILRAAPGDDAQARAVERLRSLLS